MRISFCLLLLLACVASEVYDGHKLFSVTPHGDEQLKVLNTAITKLNLDLWYWKEGSAHIRVSPTYLNIFDTLGLENEIIHEDVQVAFDEQMRANNNVTAQDWFAQYHDYPGIVKFLDDLVASTNDPSRITRGSMGASYQERDISGVIVGTGTGKKRIFFNGGQHAREWLTPPTVCYIAEQLLKPENAKYFDAFEWHLAPVMNPDGYQYTWTNSRLWRKSRSPTSNPSCIGTDLNRNWAYQWNTGGSSNNPCSDTYHGARPFDNVETKAISDYVAEKDPISYIDFHCCGQMWMNPYGWSCSQKPADVVALEAAGNMAAAGIRSTHGRNFAVGSVCEVIYQASGGSLDWTYATAGVKYSYAIEARGSFTSPPSEIKPCVEELWAGVKGMADYILANES